MQIPAAISVPSTLLSPSHALARADRSAHGEAQAYALAFFDGLRSLCAARPSRSSAAFALRPLALRSRFALQCAAPCVPRPASLLSTPRWPSLRVCDSARSPLPPSLPPIPCALTASHPRSLPFLARLPPSLPPIPYTPPTLAPSLSPPFPALPPTPAAMVSLSLAFAALAVLAAVSPALAQNGTCPGAPLAPGRYEFTIPFGGLDRCALCALLRSPLPARLLSPDTGACGQRAASSWCTCRRRRPAPRATRSSSTSTAT